MKSMACLGPTPDEPDELVDEYGEDGVWGFLSIARI